MMTGYIVGVRGDAFHAVCNSCEWESEPFETDAEADDAGREHECDAEVVDDPFDDTPAAHAALLEAVIAWAETGALGDLERRPSIEQAGAMVHAVQRARSALGLVEDMLAEWLLDVAGTGLHETGVVPPFEVRVGRDRKEWQHDSLVRDLVPRIAVDVGIAGAVTEDGERVDTADVVRLVIERFRECSSDGWKVTGLRALMLDPEDYCKSSRGRVSVNFP